MKFKISLGQIDTQLGNVQANLEKHLVYIDEALHTETDLLVFPELSLTGYSLQDLVPSVALQPSTNDPAFATLLEASKKLDLVFGFVEEDQRSRFFISSAYLSQGEILYIHRKVYLPTYSMFDEGRYFARGDAIQAFDTRFGRSGMLICEDFWHISPPYLLWLDGADLLIFTSALPGHGLTSADRFESTWWTEQIQRTYASLFTSYIVFTNRFGYEDGTYFPGGAIVIDPAGEVVVRAKEHQEDMITAEIDLSHLHRLRSHLPLLRDERIDLVQRELKRILKSEN
jgi:NAD+ synthase (glutamine-hydrolysing)